MDGERELTTADIAHPGLGSDASPETDASAEPVDAGIERTEPGADEPLLPPVEAQRFSDDWKAVQGNFVDKPREAVERADRLVADLMQRLASGFSETRASLEQQWEGHEDISTEDLRVALTRYRTFFERLLAA
jgi:hypothetical protein